MHNDISWEEFFRTCRVAALGYIGIRQGIFKYLHNKKRSTIEEIAEDCALDVAYLERWFEAAWAHGILLRNHKNYSLSKFANQLFVNTAQGASIGLALFQMLVSYEMLSMMKSGEQAGFDFFARYPDLAIGEMLEKSFMPVLENEILAKLKIFERVGKRGGNVLDIGCGSGWFLMNLALKYPLLRGTGIDGFKDSISVFQEKIQKHQLSDRIQAKYFDIKSLPCNGREYDIICLNFSLHHIWGEDKMILEKISRLLKPEGALAIWEYNYPEGKKKLRESRFDFLAFQNLAEHVLGGTLLRKREIIKAVRNLGFTSKTYSINGDSQCLIICSKE